jgi:hypothetical protein
MKVTFQTEPVFNLTKDDLATGEVYFSDAFFGEYMGDRPVWLRTDEACIVELTTGYQLKHGDYSDETKFARANAELTVNMGPAS